MGASRIKKHREILAVLSKAKPALAKKIIKGADRDLINTFAECCKNLIKGNVPLSPAQRAQLRRHKQGLRQVAQRTTSNKRKKEILQQRGGFLGALLTAVLPLAIQGVTQIIKKVKKKKRRT